MNQLTQVTRPQELAEEIRQLVRLTVEGVVEIGYRLIEARNILKPQGKWLEWLDSEFGWERSTAYNLMRAAEAVRKEPRLLRFRSPSVLYLVSGAPEEVIEQLLEFDVGYAEAKLVIDAHKWAEKTRMVVDALQQVDMKEAYAQGNARTVNLVRMTAARILAELDAAMDNGEAREMAVEMYREHGVWLAEVTETDPIENTYKLTLRERHGEPATGKVRVKRYEENGRTRLTAWCPDPYDIAIFPRTGNAQADAWRVRFIEACLEAAGQ